MALMTYLTDKIVSHKQQQFQQQTHRLELHCRARIVLDISVAVYSPGASPHSATLISNKTTLTLSAR